MQKDSITVLAGAKINLTLDVLGLREDGYHDMRMIMQTVSLHDEITIELHTGFEPEVKTNLPYLPTGLANLAGAAAEAFFRETGISHGGYNISINKAIPVCAGLAGGSTDAAAVLRGLNKYYGGALSDARLLLLGEALGSDVPYCMTGGTALAEGRGERLTQVRAMPECYVLLCKPGFPVSTGRLFSAIDSVKIERRPDTEGALEMLEKGDLYGLSQKLFNVFEAVLNRREIYDIKKTMQNGGALGACMSGTGPTVFGLFDSLSDAERTKKLLSDSYKDVFVAKTE